MMWFTRPTFIIQRSFLFLYSAHRLRHLLVSPALLGDLYCFINKETNETAYLLDKIPGWKPHARLSDGTKACIVEVAAQCGYEKAEESVCMGEDRVGRQTVMRQVQSMEVPSQGQKEVNEKRKVKYLYAETDEDHISLQYKEKKGDIKRYKGYADNGQTIKLVYVHEGYVESVENTKRKELKNVFYQSDGGAWMKKAIWWICVLRYKK